MDSPSFLDSLKDAWQDDAPGEEPGLPDESSSPHLNTLIRVVRRFQAGEARPLDLRRALEDMAARLELATRDHETLYRSQDLSEELATLAEDTLQAYGRFRGGLEALQAGQLDEGVERCKEAASQLEVLYAQFAEVQQRESLARCLMCSHLNQPNLRTCARCGAVLPEQMEKSAAARDPGSSDLVMIPPEYVALYNACEAVASGQMEVEEWRRAVDSLWHTFSQSRTYVEMHLARHSADLDTAAELRPVADALLEGLRAAEGGLAEMLLYQEDGDAEHLNEGWVTLLKGTRKVQESSAIFFAHLQALNRAAAEREEAKKDGGEEGRS